MYFALNKATDFFKKQPWHTYPECVAGTICANIRTVGERGSGNGKPIVTFSLVYLWGLVYYIYILCLSMRNIPEEPSTRRGPSFVGSSLIQTGPTQHNVHIYAGF